MHKHIADKWVQALRSGDYKQTTGHLRTDEGFCCLGVLCDLHRQESEGAWRTDEHGQMLYKLPSGDWNHAMLPKPVREWAGLRSINPEINSEPLSGLNDGGWTFGDIAEVIDLSWEAL